METVTFKIPKPVLTILTELAAAQDVSLGQIIRSSLHREIGRQTNAKTPNRADELLVAPIRALLADDFAYSQNWQQLQTRLAKKGYGLREAGGGLILVNCSTNARLCKASELGHAYSQLMRKFKAPFPGHSHHHLYRRVMSNSP